MDFRFASPLDATALSDLVSSRFFSPKKASDIIKDPENIVVLAMDHGEVIGMGLLTRSGLLRGIYVKPPRRREGIGTSLFRLCYEEFAKGGKKNFVAEVGVKDKSAKAFLEALGMSVVKETLEFQI
ncbi:MAG: GNAT family N-acetyltransferase [Candidatus Enteromonas sp.]|nr:GNAT family N-acetyltransferase [Candidatus Enteromonas sp.]